MDSRLDRGLVGGERLHLRAADAEVHGHRLHETGDGLMVDAQRVVAGIARHDAPAQVIEFLARLAERLRRGLLRSARDQSEECDQKGNPRHERILTDL